MDAFMNEYDIVIMDDQQVDFLHMGFGVIESTVESLSQLPAQNQHASLNKALTQEDILESFQNSSGSLDYLPNQVSAINSQTPVPSTQNMDSSMSNEHIARLQTNLEDPTGDLSLFKNYCIQDGDKADAHHTVEQDLEDLYHILAKDQNEIVGVNGCQDTQEVLCGSVDDSQIPLPVHDMTQDNISLQNSNVSMTMNTVNQSGGAQVAVNIASPSLLTNQRATLIPFNQENSEDKYQFPQFIDSMPAATSSGVVGGNMPSQNNTVVLNSNELPKKVSAVNPNEIHVTWQNVTDLPITNESYTLTSQTPASCTQNIGQMKTKAKRTGKVGRCPQGVLPLYLQPEPENEEEKRTWNRAKTAHKHREVKKNALVNDANTIKDLMKEMNELRNQLNVVTAQRDSYKNTLNNLVNNVPKY